MQKYDTENGIPPEQLSRWNPATHEFNPSGTDYYAPGYLGGLNLLKNKWKTLKIYFGDDIRE